MVTTQCNSVFLSGEKLCSVIARKGVIVKHDLRPGPRLLSTIWGEIISRFLWVLRPEKTFVTFIKEEKMGSINGSRALKSVGVPLFLFVVLFSLTLNQVHAYPAPKFQDVLVCSVQNDNGTGSIYTLFYARVSGPSPEDVTSFTATGPSGTFNLTYNRSFRELGLYYAVGYSEGTGIIDPGAYTFQVTDNIGRSATVVRDFTYDETLPQVDSATMIPGNEAYVGTTTPTLSFDPVAGAVYYQVIIQDYDRTAIWYTSPITTATSYTVPSGLLQPNTAYIWQARVWDSATNPQNLQVSNPFTFYTGTKAAPELTLYNLLSFPSGTDDLGFFPYGRAINVAPWDITYFQCIGPDLAIYNLAKLRFQFNFPAYISGWKVFDPPTSTPPNGTYIFQIENIQGEGTFATKEYTYDPIPDFIADTRLPDNNSYFDTLPTFSWSRVQGDPGDGSYLYSIRVTDYTTNMRWVDSPSSPDTTFTPSTNTLPLGSSYKWRVNVIDARSNNYRNSDYRTFTINDVAPPQTATVTGKITNTDTGEGLSEATVSFDQGEYVLTTASDGTFSSSIIPAGTYEVEISATNYYTKTLSNVTLSAGMTNDLSSALTPKSPEIVSTGANPDEVYNDGATTTLLTAKVTHPDGSGDILSVVVDLAQIGGSASQEMYDDGTYGDAVSGDGTYSYQTTVATATPVQQFSLNVTASDLYGFKAYGNINLKVIKKIVATAEPEQVDTHTITNSLSNQTLVVSFKLDSLKTSKYGGFQGESECYVELTIYKPDGIVDGVYNVTESIDISIPNAEAGDWEFKTVNKCTVSVTYEIETKGSGTGMFVGKVTNAYTGLGIVGATVTCNTGGSTVTLDDGYFSGVAVAGTEAAVTSTATGYHTDVQVDIAIMAGAATSLTIQMISDASTAQPVPSSQQLYVINEPKEDPDPLTQPFAAKELQGNLYLNALFPLYQEPVNIYVGVTPDIPGMAGKIFLFNKNNELVELTDTLYPWREGVTASQSSQILSYPLSLLPAFSCIFYSMVTTDPVSLSNYDLVSFTLPINQATTKADPAATGLFLKKMLSSRPIPE